MTITLKPNFDTKQIDAYQSGVLIGSFRTRAAAAEALGIELQPVVLTRAQERAVAKAQRESRAQAGKSRGLGGRYQG